MPTQKKIDTVEKLSELLSESQVIIATDYRGLSVSELSDLRARLREKGVVYHVVKNTLATLAAQKAGKPGLASLLRGPTALATSSSEATEVAKAIAAYARTAKTPLAVRGALLGDAVLVAEQVISLATLPSREVLLGRLLGLMQAPAASLQRVLVANLQQLLNVFQARIEQLGGTADVA